MSQTLEEKLTQLVSEASLGNFSTVGILWGQIDSGIAKLRDRIDELGGYHDDV